MSKRPTNKATPETFTIAPLDWQHVKRDDYESWSAHTIFCTVTVDRNTWNYDNGVWSPWKFSYCRDEYYDEHSEEVESAKDGKAKAEQWYLKTLMPALCAVKTPTERTPK